jgi:hypothetical protein
MILLLHTVSTFSLLGLIWFVQLVHYPLFAHAARGSFSTLAINHQKRTSLVVVPLMTTELFTATTLALAPPPGAALLARVGLLLLVIIWTSTALLQVPLHRRLVAGFDRSVISRLVRTNWLRTLLWSARSWIAVLLLSEGVTA